MLVPHQSEAFGAGIDWVRFPAARHMKNFFAGGFLFNPGNNKILLHKRDSKTKINPNKWGFFGGKSENDEKPLETFIREMREELGIEISEDQIIPLCSYLNKEFNTYRYVFYVESDLKKSQMQLGEGADFEWISLSDAVSYDLTDKTKKDLELFIKNISKHSYLTQ